MSFRILTLSMVSCLGLMLTGCGGEAPPASISGPKSTPETAKTPGEEPVEDTVAAILAANSTVEPEIQAEVAASMEPSVLQEAARHLEGVWTGVVELNDEAIEAQKVPQDVVEKMKAMSITLEFLPGDVAKMTATTQTEEGPVTETVDATWEVTAALGQEVVIAWQEPDSRAELHQLKFENNNVFTRPPPGGNERNRDLGQIRFTRVQVSQR